MSSTTEQKSSGGVGVGAGADNNYSRDEYKSVADKAADNGASKTAPAGTGIDEKSTTKPTSEEVTSTGETGVARSGADEGTTTSKGDETTQASDGAGGAGGQTEYPEQKHAGKVGLGPNYHNGPTVGDKITGFKEQIKGKITKNPELVEKGHDRQTGELEKKKEQEDDANDPFAAEKDAQKTNKPEGETAAQSDTKEKAATAGTESK